jgi:hypothetical protein
MDKEQRLSRLADAAAARSAAESLVTDCVVSARLAGATWNEIGGALGITAQGANKRYAIALPYQYPLPSTS